MVGVSFRCWFMFVSICGIWVCCGGGGGGKLERVVMGISWRCWWCWWCWFMIVSVCDM